MHTKMASGKLVFSFIITLLLIFLLPPSHAATHSDPGDIKDSSSINRQKVNLSVYYEALCPSCANFIVQSLVRVFNDDLINIINLRMVPWGNAHVNKTDSTIICQNGLDECVLNTIQACAINVWHDVNKYYALIYCIEFLAIEGRHSNWQSCFSSLGLPEKPILDCYNNGTGAKLQALYGYETAHLSPPQTFVPWVVVDSKQLGNVSPQSLVSIFFSRVLVITELSMQDYEKFTTYICNAYKSNVIPNACKALPPNNVSSSKEENPIHPVCYRDEAKNLTSLEPVKRILFSMPEFCNVGLLAHSDYIELHKVHPANFCIEVQESGFQNGWKLDSFVMHGPHEIYFNTIHACAISTMVICLSYQYYGYMPVLSGKAVEELASGLEWGTGTVSSPLLSFLALPSLLFLFVTPSDSSEYGIPKSPDPPVRSRRISRNSEKVTMSLCYEFLCPYCNSFIADPLAQVLETDLMTILNLRLVPWGNAILDSNNTIECQVAFPSSDFVSFFFFKNVLSKFRCDHLLLWFFGSMGKRNAI
ncbi:hypothetical protein POTOM_025260 [Populus tomentosa]|uniref:Uncharacterized protein n=1 Tax=Populus tomentosa TaxID=118781 RepID=A0A8X8CX00_POPTO|nr:hypothetical protein POTOM_025260 [Populus tomentosa]